MILARTFQSPNLHLMQLNTPRPEQALYKPKELLEVLRASPLYDPERGQWNTSMDKDQRLLGSYRYASNQLLGILVLAEFDQKNAAKEAYERLKTTALYDKVSEQWNVYMNKDQLLQPSNRYAEGQLLDILVLAEFDKNTPKEAYEQLKDTALYDNERSEWIRSINKDQPLESSDRLAKDQLLGILVLAEFDLKFAKESYERLKTTQLYDKERAQWNSSMDKDQALQDSDRSSCNLLLDILVLAEFLPNAAKEAYERLKTTQLYDKERKQWNRRMYKDQELQDSRRYAEDQLLAIVVESKLLKLFPPPTPLIDETLTLPTVWRGR